MAHILVIGSSGAVGSELVRELVSNGHTVRGTTHKRSGDAERVHVDLATGEGLRAAFEGIDRAFLMSPGGYADQHRVLSPLIQEAKRRGLQKVVLMTAMGADANEATPLRRAEVELEKSGLPYSIIRPNWFMQNFNTFWVSGIREHGKISLPAKRAKVSFIDTRDISAVAARLLSDATHANRAFTLTGAEALDHDEVAALLSKASGKRITYAQSEPAELRAGLVGAGLPEDYADFLVLIMGFLAEGYSRAVTDDVERLLDRRPRSLARYAEEYVNAWR
ncbi:MAG TPA: SDR family oxidoreductase [Myxococcota bacterium]|nr:SDR family oxidoreductase [Myxococcota bacterium]